MDLFVLLSCHLHQLCAAHCSLWISHSCSCFYVFLVGRYKCFVRSWRFLEVLNYLKKYVLPSSNRRSYKGSLRKKLSTIFYGFNSGFGYIFFLIPGSIKFPPRFTSTPLKFLFPSNFYWTWLKEWDQMRCSYNKTSSVSVFLYESKDWVFLFPESALVGAVIQLKVNVWNKSLGVKTLVSMLCAFWKGLFEVLPILQAVCGWSS